MKSAVLKLIIVLTSAGTKPQPVKRAPKTLPAGKTQLMRDFFWLHTIKIILEFPKRKNKVKPSKSGNPEIIN